MGSFSYPETGTNDRELFEAFVAAHETKLRTAAVPESKWRTLCHKLNHSIFDAGQDFVYLSEQAAEDENSEAENPHHLKVYTKCPMSPDDIDHIYLIDHAWTYTLETAKRTLEENLSLTTRMAAILEVDVSDTTSQIINILKKMWLFNNCYIVKSGNQTHPSIDCWYILDEFGSRIQYSEDPSFVIVPFFYFGDNSMYSLLFPKIEVLETEEVTVSYPNYLDSLSEDIKRCLICPWNISDLTDIDFNLCEPSIDYFASGRSEEILPEADVLASRKESLSHEPLGVFSEYADVVQFLTHPSFKLVNNKEEAKVLWLASRQYNVREHFEKYPNLSFISQFPSEHVLINKDLMAAVCRRHAETAVDIRTLHSYPEWLPATFNLATELPKFVSYYQHRQNRHLENIWICKPFNLARGLGIHVTDDLTLIIRLSQVRPMVACKYISDPVLFPMPEKGLVKMDLRYIVLLKNTHPLELYAYERFWLRFAHKPFVLDDFTDYETHFTVMNYTDLPIQQMFCHDFIQKFEDYYSSCKWSDIQEKIYKMIKDIFVASTLKEPPAGVGNFSGSRAIYGLDIMLQWDKKGNVPEIKPVILEVNWMPDCNRACQYYPEFYNDVFSILFLGDAKDKHAVQL